MRVIDVIFDQCDRGNAQHFGNLTAQSVGDGLGLRVRTVDADEAGSVATTRAEAARAVPTSAELDEFGHIAPIGAVEEPKVGRDARAGQDEVRPGGLLKRQPRARMTTPVDALQPQRVWPRR